MRLPPHGANPLALYRAIGISVPESIIDFSENTNPLGPPESIKEQWMEWQSLISNYPDPDGTELRKTIAKLHNLKPEQVLLGNGAAELMMVATRLFQQCKVGIIHPAFSEYERVIKANQAEIHSFYTDERNDWTVNDREIQSFLSEPDRALYVCNPSNPTGIPIQPKLIEGWIRQAEQSGSMIFLDEAFVDMIGEEVSMSRYIGSESLLIFRSMTKMYSIAGLRLGCVLGHEKVLSSLAKWLPHWNVNALSLLAGQTVLQDPSFAQNTRSYIKEERTRLFKAFHQMGFRTSDSKTNYYLVQPSDPYKTPELFTWLLERGIVLRHTENFKGLDGRWLRAGIKTRQQNDRLIQAVTAWHKEQSSQ